MRGWRALLVVAVLCSTGVVGTGLQRARDAPADTARCPHDCFAHLGHGHCDDGVCQCEPQYTGDDCLREKTDCLNDCQAHGTCVSGVCRCDAGWSGPDCGVLQSCPSDCNGRGVCVSGACQCDPGFTGDDCDQVVTSCPKDCNGRGACIEGACHCDRGYTGTDCGTVAICKEVAHAELDVCSVLAIDPAKQYFVPADLDVRRAESLVVAKMRAVNATCEDGSELSRARALSIVCAKFLPFCHPRTQQEVPGCRKQCTDVARECSLDVEEFCPKYRFVSAEEADVPPYHFYRQESKWLPKCKEVYLPGELACPNLCSKHGRCDTQRGVCMCHPLWQADDCSVPKCPNDCSQHGTCLGEPTLGVCRCDDGWTTADCSVRRCKNDCSGASHGRCNNGTCECIDPWGSDDCSVPKCPRDCSGHGVCLAAPTPGQCKCDAGWRGEACELMECPRQCSNHGDCDGKTGICTCHEPWTQDDCSVAKCPNDCSKHGTCLQRPTNGKPAGACECDATWFGDDCSLKACPNDCSNHGQCNHHQGTCTCSQPYFSEDCSKSHCPKNCHVTHGVCQTNGKCKCFEPWVGEDCGKAVCPNDCSQHGACLQTSTDAGKCLCNPPWGKEDCSVVVCENDCSHHGECGQSGADLGKCACDAGWTGSDCSLTKCPNDCSKHGHCVDGKCHCNAPWGTEDCSVPQCPKNCTSPSRGTCDPKTGVCKCKAPFVGIDCSVALCPEDCSHHGWCDRDTGKCTCEDPFFGTDCSKQKCPSDCSGHGECNQDNGLCSCQENWFGEACAETTQSPSPSPSPSVSPTVSPTPTPSLSEGASPSVSPSPSPSSAPSASSLPSRSPYVACPNECSGHGDCNTGTGACACADGWSGDDCAAPVCRDECHARGQCKEPELCLCNDGFYGDACQHVRCPNGCSGHGECDDSQGTCACDVDWTETDCSVKKCPEYCDECVDGRCVCKDPNSGPRCEKLCNPDCGEHGHCKDGVCVCDPPFQGADCSKVKVDAHPPPKCDCKGHGKCVDGVCQCDKGFRGVDCSLRVCDPPCDHGTCQDDGTCKCDPPARGKTCSSFPCPGDPECSDHGTCLDSGECECEAGFTGKACAEFSCPANCSRHGECKAPDTCECFDGWGAEDCSQPVCPGTPPCSNHGECVSPEKCKCEVGWAGDDCAQQVPCPNDCSGHGECRDLQCWCEPDWLGNDCALEVTESCRSQLRDRGDGAGCNGRGVCTCSGACQCSPGFVGRLCQRPARCEGGCSGRGQCVADGSCRCYDGYTGARCEQSSAGVSPATVEPCPNDCSGQGFCSLGGVCQCFVGFGGDNCSLTQPVECPKACSNHGICEVFEDASGPECMCAPGWTGESCSEPDSACPVDCSCHGTCEGDQCVCDEGFAGVDCSEPTCPNDCSGHGMCDDGSCHCQKPWYTFDCSVAMCPYNCSKHGQCDGATGKCTCDPGYSGDDCSRLPCPGNPMCSDHGECDDLTGQCQCQSAFEGEACECRKCPLSCSFRGDCDCEGKCACYEPFHGDACELLPCPNDCSGHGQCNARFGNCTCDAFWTLEDCSRKVCPGEAEGAVCNNHGVCDPVQKTCECDLGWTGAGCKKRTHTPCPYDCSPPNGECVVEGDGEGDGDGAVPPVGKCRCNAGWTGPSCSLPATACPVGLEGKTCSANGDCIKGSCFCYHGWQGRACDQGDTPACPQDCSDRGVCVNGRCKCEPYYVGTACQDLRCAKNCSGHGQCDLSAGECACAPGWETLSPEDCADGPHFACDPECVHGRCNFTTGECECDEFWQGAACEDMVCPGNQGCQCVPECSEFGRCDPATQTCVCEQGFTGERCEVPPPPPPPECSGCSGRGDCNCTAEPVELPDGTSQCACECFPGFQGPDCEDIVQCPTHNGVLCSGRGVCELGKCRCNVGFDGVDCSEANPKNPFDCPVRGESACAGNGECLITGQCQCFPGWAGEACDVEVGKCPASCSGFGICGGGPPSSPSASDTSGAAGSCGCIEELQGPACSQFVHHPVVTLPCPQNCSGHGICCNGRCRCADGWAGATCALAAPSCPLRCSGNGVCQADGACKCERGYYGEGCASGPPKAMRCPRDCMGRGVCDGATGKCRCEYEHEGVDCAMHAARCPNNCTGNGICRGAGPGLSGGRAAVCECLDGYSGEDCSVALRADLDATVCEDNCSGHGTCLDYQCFCSSEYAGRSCALLDRKCPSGCSGFGACQDGCCACEPGHVGLNCGGAPWGLLAEEPLCRNNCTGHGVCSPTTRRCTCQEPWQHNDCSVLAEACPDDCNGRGECYFGRCVCDAGFAGFACDIDLSLELAHSHQEGYERGLRHEFFNLTKACYLGCSAHGACDGVTGQCACQEGWDGLGCEIGHQSAIGCPANCSGHGECVDAQCACDAGYYGVSCEQTNLPCPFHCSGKGMCSDGECACFPGFSGDACEHPTYARRCKTNCTGQGECIDGDCHCPTGYRGEDCAITIGRCPASCSGNGRCTTDDACACASGFTGRDCSVPLTNHTLSHRPCPQNCSGKGLCELGWCECDADQGHYDCGVTVFVCPKGCSGKGRCVAGLCECEPGFAGEDCGTGVFGGDGGGGGLCPQNCSGRGRCDLATGKCACFAPWVGEACDHVSACPRDCMNRGVCEPACGLCTCHAGWGGVDCSKPNGCPNDCSGNGECVDGVCYCDPLFTDRDCSVGRSLGALCRALQLEAPGFLGTVQCPEGDGDGDGDEDPAVVQALRQAVADKWDTEPAGERAARIFRAMANDQCTDRLARVCDRIVLLALKIHDEHPKALTRYGDIKHSCYDLAYVHATFDARMRLREVQDADESTPRFVANDVALFVQECNLFHALVFDFERRDDLRYHRSTLEKLAQLVTDMDPSIILFDAHSVDDLLDTLRDPDQGAMLLRRAAGTAADPTARLVHGTDRANRIVDAAVGLVREAVDELYDLGYFLKYFREVVDLVERGKKALRLGGDGGGGGGGGGDGGDASVRGGVGAPTGLAPLPHNLDLGAAMAVLLEDNTAEKARDAVFGHPDDSPERAAVVKLVAGLNILAARGTHEVPDSAKMFDSRTRVKELAVLLYKTDPAAIDDPSAFSPSTVVRMLSAPKGKAKLQALQSTQGSLHKTATLLLNEVAHYQWMLHFLVDEAKRLSFSLRTFDETLVPFVGAGAVALGNTTTTATSEVQRIVALARTRGYVRSVEGYLTSGELAHSAALTNDVREFLKVLKALGEVVPVNLIPFTVMGALQLGARETQAQLLAKGCLPAAAGAMPSVEALEAAGTSFALLDLLRAPAVLAALTELAAVEDDGAAGAVGADEGAPNVPLAELTCAQLARRLLAELDELSDATDQVVSLVRLIAEAMSAVTSASGSDMTLSVPSPWGHDNVELLSKLYDYSVWDGLRLCDSSYRLQNSAAQSLEEDQDELIRLVEEASQSGELGWGVQCHAIVDLVVGVLGLSSVEETVRDAQLAIEDAAKLVAHMEQLDPSLAGTLKGLQYVPPLCTASLPVFGNDSAAVPPVSKKIMYIAVAGLPADLADRCGECCGAGPAIAIANADDGGGGQGTPAVESRPSLVGNPRNFLSAAPEALVATSTPLAVRCCGLQGERVSMGLYGCHAGLGYWEATKLCAASNLRLCTVAELTACTTCGTGCGFDLRRVWALPDEAVATGGETPPPPDQQAAQAAPAPPRACEEDPLLATIAQLEQAGQRVAEQAAELEELAVAAAVPVKANTPHLVPSLAGMDLALEDPTAVMAALVPLDAFQALLGGLVQLPHGQARVDGSSLLHIVHAYTTLFTSALDGGPGTLPAVVADPDTLNPAPCSTRGVYLGTQCVCEPGAAGEMCEFNVNRDEAFDDGWRQGFEASLSNVTAFSEPQDIVQRTVSMFDRAAQLVKGTAMAIADSSERCEALLPTSHLSAVEILQAMEDPGWLAYYRKCPDRGFVTNFPKLAKEATLLRQEYDDIAALVKHLAIKGAVLDCTSMTALMPPGRVPECKRVSLALTLMQPHEVLDRAVLDASVMSFQSLLRAKGPGEPLKHVVNDLLELATVVLKHMPCPYQCSRHGVCLLRTCHCFEGWTGEACSHEARLAAGRCPRNCTNHGECRNGTCLCDLGWRSTDCSQATSCPNNCNGKGDCIDATCKCFRGWRGYDCSLRTEICPDDFACLHGFCRDTICVCEHGWTGDDCTIGDFLARQSDGFWE